VRAQETHPDVIQMDLLMPGMDGIEATRQIISCRSGAQVLVLTSFAADNDKLMRAIRQVHRGEPSLDPTIARKLLQEIARPAKLQPAPKVLTAHEMIWYCG
jgi:DNA-binding NarL/FixJ family response regulator